MWKDTNYKPQVDEMNKAGINPALLYGMSGGGGVTVGSGAGGAASGSVSAQNSGVAGMGLGIQMELLKAQKENIEADTKNKLAEAEYTGGAKTELTNTQKTLGDIDAEIKGKTIEDAQEIITQTASKAYEDAQSAALNNFTIKKRHQTTLR